MENSGKAIDSVSFTGWPDARVIPYREHRTATAEHPPKATRACEMAGLYGLNPGLPRVLEAGFPVPAEDQNRRENRTLSGSSAPGQQAPGMAGRLQVEIPQPGVRIVLAQLLVVE